MPRRGCRHATRGDWTPASVGYDVDNSSSSYRRHNNISIDAADALKRGGIPVRGEAISHIGAVDPAKGMWRCGADESTLPAP